ncbi:MAG: GNAT family N-acetyltransferase [Acidobacteria bacterium]|nr:GNAT family N-acetyltransferase [Acidobacteriota bacterium]
MEPTLPDGSLVSVVPADSDEINVHDLIAFRLGGEVVVHRVARIRREADARLFLAGGDSSELGHTWITGDELLGLAVPVAFPGTKAPLARALLQRLQSFPLYKVWARALGRGVRLREQQLNETTHRFAALQGNRVVGSACLSLSRGATEAWISNLWVHWTLRRAGIGRRLLEAAEVAARRQGAYSIRLRARKGARPALALYANASYHCLDEEEGQILVLTKELSPGFSWKTVHCEAHVASFFPGEIFSAAALSHFPNCKQK